MWHAHLFAWGTKAYCQALAEWLRRGRSHPWCIPNTPFYWLAARQSFFLLVDMISQEMPARLLPIADAIADEVLAPRQPHAYIAHIAKRTALRLAEFDAAVFSSRDSREDLRKGCNRRSSKSLITQGVVANAQTGEQDVSHSMRWTRFDIGSLRFQGSLMFRLTVSATWQNVGFATNGSTLGTVWATDPVRQWNRYAWELTSNSHGSQPLVD